MRSMKGSLKAPSTRSAGNWHWTERERAQSADQSDENDRQLRLYYAAGSPLSESDDQAAVRQQRYPWNYPLIESEDELTTRNESSASDLHYASEQKLSDIHD